jgi:hypothetical protein
VRVVMKEMSSVLFDLLKDLFSDKFIQWFNAGGVSVLLVTLQKSYFWLLIALVFILIVISIYFFKIYISAGIKAVYTPRKLSVVKSLEKSNKSFYFLGVSAKTTAAEKAIGDRLVELSQDGSFEIKFLLMNPNADENIRARALDEKEITENHANAAWKSDMDGAINRLKDLAKKNQLSIQIRLYDEYPLWRMFVIDREVVYLNYALTGKRLNASPLVKLKSQKDSLANTFIQHFDLLWEKSEPVDMNSNG